MQQYTDADLAVWIQQAHDTSLNININITKAILNAAGVHQRAHTTIEPNDHQRWHTAAINLNHSSLTNARVNQTLERWIDGPDEDPIHRRARRNAQVHGRV